MPVTTARFTDHGYTYTGNKRTAIPFFKSENEIDPRRNADDRVSSVKGKKQEKKRIEKKDDIGGPSQPEMSAFKPVGADNMVDPFSGDFSYNIPLLDVGGYPVNIFYNSGITMDQEASWAGLGWNINPGTIMRNMRGLPDDFNGTDIITKTQYTKPDQTWGVNVGAKAELFGGPVGLGLSVDQGMFYNNMRGVGLEAGIRPAISIGGKTGDKKAGPLSFGWKLNANSQSGGSSTFSISLEDNNKKGRDGSLSASIGVHSRQGLMALHIDGEVHNIKTGDKTQASIAQGNVSISPTIGTSINFAYPSFVPAMRNRISSENYDIDMGFGVELQGFNPHIRLGGYYTRQWIREKDISFSQPAYGMIYLNKGQQDKNALLDFNRVNDGVYTPGTPAISIPVYTYDVYSISGEGTGGSFRAYRGDLGYMQDSYLENDGVSGHLGFEVGGGSYGKGGLNARVVLTPSSSGGWEKGNIAKIPMAFKESHDSYQAVYFKNPGEKAIPDLAYQEAIGGEDLVRLKMINTGVGSPTLINSFVRYTDMLKKKDDLKISTTASLKARDKRTQVISFLTAYEADRVGLNKRIKYINLNEADSNTVVFGCSNTNRDSIRRFDATRKQHHISEIDVLMQDGRRYVYDIPVYNLEQVEVTFNKKGSGGGNGANDPITDYIPGTDDEAIANKQGKDGYVEKQSMPPYAHSYLLTGLLSPNYVDVKGDGITDDDMGDAIKFNYSKSGKDLKWRTPYNDSTATLSEGLKTDKNDDKAHYVYGKREMWYLYSIESKNMVARFYVRKDRKDSRAVADENGGIDDTFGAYRLSRISLFTKGELLKNPTNPKPVKTVHFEYDYSLCQGAPGSVSGYGKLTLRSIYFTYNGNNKVKKNFYRFNYPTGTKNPDYDFSANDRWGNYKPNETHQNPGDLSNADYPYVNKDTAKTNEYAQAWTMNQVILPSGAAINVEYESDDYAFVQDRRAASMMHIAGFGTSATPAADTAKLYSSSSSMYDYIYITVPRAITATISTTIKSQIQAWYLGNMNKNKQVYMRLAVNMPSDKMGSGYELVPVYADVEDYGVVSGTSGGKIWLRVRKLASGYTPMVHYSLQFLKSNLPSKAYPGYDVSEEGGLKAIVKAMGGLYHSFKEIFNGGIKLMMAENKCKTTNLAKSFIRLTDPYLDKPGGGLRVKKVVINDNWDKMTKSSPEATDGMLNATYGQEYFYTKKELVNGELMTISSGVASWEPALGADENPHREALEYYNRTPKADFDYRVMEVPLTEMMYPSASVGYSRVETRSIHRDTVKNAAGISVTEFYTSREFPTTTSFTPLSEYNAEDRFESGALDKLLKADLKTAVALSQGFKVDLNDMNGKMKKQATYSPNNLNDPISYTENFYSMVKTGDNTFKLNHNFPVIAGSDGKIVQSLVGREIEIMTDFREHQQQTITTNIDFNVDIIDGVFIPIPVPTTWKPIIRESNIYRSASVLKIVNHYSVLDSVVAVDKGSMVSTKNLVYDAETGDPLLVRTNNEHNQPVYNFSYPAHWAYSGMGLAYKNIDVLYSGLTFKYGKLEPTGSVNLDLFESGDEIMVESQKTVTLTGSLPCDPSVVMIKSSAKKIWAINTGKAGSTTPQWLFIDADGNPYSATEVSMRIIRSGKRNMYSAGLGSITTLKNPVNVSTGQLEFTDSTNILQTAAATYKDHWRVDDALYVKDSVTTATVQARVRRRDYYPTDNVMVYMHEKVGDKDPPDFTAGKYSYLLMAKRSVEHHHGQSSEMWVNRSYLLYDYSTYTPPSGANFYKALLSIYSHTDRSPTLIVHPGLHGNSSSQTPRILGEVRSLKGPWYTNTDASSWGAVYINGDYVSAGMSPVPVSVVGDESYTLNNGRALDITNIVRENAGTPLNLANKLGLQFSLINDKIIDGGNSQYRCFWADNGVKNFTIPILSYYYYVCGDTASHYDYNNDPYENTLLNCYSVSVDTSYCLSKFTQRKSVNPYVEGIWGNWRVDTSFVYYGDRKENTIVDGTPVDLRKGGTIISYKPFWNFSASITQFLARNYAGSDVWVWNSAITQYNRKGYEIENKDPLNRFNAGLYGYNQQLPIAVVNNSRYSESLFDGFEDYDYESNSCSATCKPRRHVNMDSIQLFLNTEQRHTGKTSIKINAGKKYAFTAPVVTTASLDKPYGVRVKIDSTSYTDTVVSSGGTGFTGKYYNYNCSSGWTYPDLDALTGPSVRTGEVINLQCASDSKKCPGGLDYSCGSGQPPYGINQNFFAVRWEGYIQPLTSGVHYFGTIADDGIKVTVNGTTVINRWGEGLVQLNSEATPLTLLKGQVYHIVVDYFEAKQNARAVLLWKYPGLTGYETMPASVIYPTSGAAGSTTTITTKWCTKMDSVNVRGNALTDTFSLIQSKKMLISAWVRVGGNDCKCSTYTNNKIRISYTGGSTVSEFTPSGSIIEGWQRYEGIFEIPAAATKMQVELMNTGSSAAVWFDDLRIHPFNANMKSFVYSPQSLRLTSELDENNYASFYEYDDDGTLSRVKKETVKGIKTITETRSHLQKAL